MSTITIELDDATIRHLDDFSAREQKTRDETAAAVLSRGLRRDLLGQMLRESERYARAAGYDSDEQILREIS